MTHVIVTGGAGFIGSHLCKELTHNGYKPIIIDDLSTGHEGLTKYGQLIKANCGDYNTMVNVFKQYQPLAIFHIAGSKSVAESVANPYKYYDNNATNTNLLLKAATNCHIKHFIFSSSATIFGIVNNKISEDCPTNPINPYGHSKLMAEYMLEGYAKSHGLIYSSLRYFNVVGADPDLELGEICQTSNNLFPLIIDTITSKQDKLTIYGDDYETKDGTCLRDYIHVSDLANAHVKALEKQIKNKQSIKINLGYANGASVKEVIKAFKDVFHLDFKVEIGQRRPGDPAMLVADNKLALDYLNWQPKYKDLKQQVRHAYQWHMKHYRIT